MQNIFFCLRAKPPLFIPKKERHRLHQFDRQIVRINSFTPIAHHSVLGTILPFYHSMKRKNRIRMMSITYRIGNSKLHEISFSRYLRGLKGAVSKLIYDYDMFVCINKPDWLEGSALRPDLKDIEYEPHIIHLHNIYAYGTHGKRYSPFNKEVRRLSQIRI